MDHSSTDPGGTDPDNAIDIDDGVLYISAFEELDFDLSNSQCLNSSEPNEEDDNGDGTIDEAAEQDCYVTNPPGGSGEVTMETREVTITVTGRLTSDNQVQASAINSIRVRNNVLRTW